MLVIAGGMGAGAEELYEIADSSIMTTVNAVMPLSEAMNEAAALLEQAADRAFRLLKIGASMRME